MEPPELELGLAAHVRIEQEARSASHARAARRGDRGGTAVRWLARTRLRRGSGAGARSAPKRLRRRETGQQPSFRGRRVTVVSAFAVIGLVMLSGAVDRQILEVDFLQKEGARRYLTRNDIPAPRPDHGPGRRHPPLPAPGGFRLWPIPRLRPDHPGLKRWRRRSR